MCDKLVRMCLIVGLGTALGLGSSYFLVWSASDASADVYWQGSGRSGAFFFRGLEGLANRVVFGGPVTINSNDGHYLVFEADQTVPMLLKQLEERFSDIPAEDVRVGHGELGGFFTVRLGERMCAILLIRDFNTSKTLLFTVMAPISLFRNRTDTLMDQGGIDPVADLRPPGSARVFCFETPTLAFAAYKSMDGNLNGFYENVLSSGDARGVSIMAYSNAELPKNGNLFFFERGVQKGFLAFQSSPEEYCSYAIICAQAQQ